MPSVINPFKTLGIAPEGIKNLPDEQIKKFVTEMYRFWAKLYHESGSRPNDEKFKIVAAAYEELTKSDAAFLEAKKRYLAPRKSQAAEMEEALSAVKAEQEAVQDRLLEFWRVHALGAKALKDGELNGFDPPACRMLMNVSLMHRMHAERPDVLADDQSAVELEVSDVGEIVRYAIEKSSSEIPEGLHPNWYGKDSKLGRYYWKRIGEGRELPGYRLCGSISEELLKSALPEVSSHRSVLGDLQTASESEVKAAIDGIEYGFVWSSFRPYASLMTPVVRPFSEVIAYSGSTPENSRFAFLGKPRAIWIQ